MMRYFDDKLSEDSLAVAEEVVWERYYQDKKWGEQNHPDFTPGFAGIPCAAGARRSCEVKASDGSISWADILIEELAEALDEAKVGNVEALREELIQVAAVAVSWAEAIDRRKAGSAS